MTWLLLGFALVLGSFPVVTKYSDRSHVMVCMGLGCAETHGTIGRQAEMDSCCFSAPLLHYTVHGSQC